MRQTRHVLRTVTLGIVTAWLAACGGRTQILWERGDGGANRNGNENRNGNGNQTAECTLPEQCIRALKWDTCCPCPVAASEADLEADPCLIPEVQSYVPSECFIECPAVECPPCSGSAKTPTCLGGQCRFSEGQCGADGECTVAVRTDVCCDAAFPAAEADLAEDSCLLRWPLDWNAIPEACLEAWDPACAAMDCTFSPPASRAVVCGDTGCEYVPECEGIGDCALAVNARLCCDCPDAWPKLMVDRDPCLVPLGESPGPGCTPLECQYVDCAPCPEPPGTYCDGATATCRAVWDDSGH